MAADQLELAGLDAEDGDRQVVLNEQFLAAARRHIRDCGGYEVVASRLDGIWGDRGRPVSASVLRAAANGTERNYFRAEWALWFARHSTECAELLLEAVGRGKPKLTPEQMVENYRREVRAILSQQKAEALIRRAEGL